MWGCGCSPVFLSDSAGDHQGGDAGCGGVGSGDGILGVGGGGDQDLPGDRREQSRDGVVVVLDALGPGGAVEGDSQGRQNGVKGVGDGGIVRCHHRLIAGILDHEGVGDPLIIHHLC